MRYLDKLIVLQVDMTVGIREIMMAMAMAMEVTGREAIMVISCNTLYKWAFFISVPVLGGYEKHNGYGGGYGGCYKKGCCCPCYDDYDYKGDNYYGGYGENFIKFSLISSHFLLCPWQKILLNLKL